MPESYQIFESAPAPVLQNGHLQKDGSLQSGRRFDLGTLENDVTGVEIIRYTAAIVQLKPVDEGGNVLQGLQGVWDLFR